MSIPKNKLLDDLFGDTSWKQAKVTGISIQARRLFFRLEDFEGFLPWWFETVACFLVGCCLYCFGGPWYLCIFLRLRHLLHVSRQVYESICSREFKARFIHVHVVVTARHGKGTYKIFVGKNATGVYGAFDYEPCMIDVWTWSVSTKTWNLKELDEFICKTETPYHVMQDNCICFVWKLHQELFGAQESYEWTKYTKFWDRLAYRFMCNEEILILEANGMIDRAKVIKEKLKNLRDI